MRKLLPSDIVGYLPHKLIAKMLDYKCDYVGREFDTVVGINQWSADGGLWSLLTEGGSKPSLDRIRPVLRPMSDLIKPLKIEGEFIAPLELLAKLHQHNFEAVSLRDEDGTYVAYGEMTISPNGMFSTQDFFEIDGDCFGIDTGFVEYRDSNRAENFFPVNNLGLIINSLYEMKFDIHGLIGYGLAIDINSLRD